MILKKWQQAKTILFKQTTMSNTENLKETTQELAKRTADIAQETTGIVKEVAEETTNQALNFLGIPIDMVMLTRLSVEWSVRLMLALLIFFVGKWIGKRFVNIAKRIMQRSRLDVTAANFLGNLLYGLVIVAVSLAALNKLGVNTNSFVAILGGAAVAIGVSLKDQLSNLAAGVMIVVFRPFNRGDFVEVGGQTGTVIDITLVNTRIKTPNNHEITIPNGDIMTSATTNYTSLPQRRLDVVVGIGYNSDIKTARQLMLEQADTHAKVLKTPEPLVRVTALGDNAVDLTLYVWVENDDWIAVQCDLLESIKYSFDEHSVSIPYPQRSLHIENLDKMAALFEKQSQAADKSVTP